MADPHRVAELHGLLAGYRERTEKEARKSGKFRIMEMHITPELDLLVGITVMGHFLAPASILMRLKLKNEDGEASQVLARDDFSERALEIAIEIAETNASGMDLEYAVDPILAAMLTMANSEERRRMLGTMAVARDMDHDHPYKACGISYGIEARMSYEGDFPTLDYHVDGYLPGGIHWSGGECLIIETEVPQTAILVLDGRPASLLIDHPLFAAAIPGGPILLREFSNANDAVSVRLDPARVPLAAIISESELPQAQDLDGKPLQRRWINTWEHP